MLSSIQFKRDFINKYTLRFTNTSMIRIKAICDLVRTVPLLSDVFYFCWPTRTVFTRLFPETSLKESVMKFRILWPVGKGAYHLLSNPVHLKEGGPSWCQHYSCKLLLSQANHTDAYTGGYRWRIFVWPHQVILSFLVWLEHMGLERAGSCWQPVCPCPALRWTLCELTLKMLMWNFYNVIDSTFVSRQFWP